VEREIFIVKGNNSITLMTTTGRVRWSKTFESRVTAIALDRQFLGVSLDNGELLLLDHEGNRVWSNRTESYVGFNDAFLIYENRLYVGDMKGFYYVFDVNGTLLAKSQTDAYTLSVDRIGDKTLVVSDKGVYTVEGELLVKRIAADNYVRAAHVDADLSAFASDRGELVAFNASGSILWNESVAGTVGRVYSAPDGVVAGTKEDDVYVMNADGNKRWSTEIGGSVTYTFLNKDYVIASSLNNTVYAFNWRGRALWVNYERLPVTALEENNQALVYGTAEGVVKYYVLAPKSAEQFYIVSALIGLVMLTGLVLVVKQWRIRGGRG